MASRAYFTPNGARSWRAREALWRRWYGEEHPRARYPYARMLAEVWISEEHRRQVVRLYRTAGSLGMEVDHVVPISSGGLHVLWNLQLLTPAQNRAKRDRLPDCYTGQLDLIGEVRQYELSL